MRDRAGIGVDCGPHGTCAASGQPGVAGHCVCDEGYDGAGCDVLTGPCADGSYITLGDDNAWYAAHTQRTQAAHRTTDSILNP
eukprot:COSAG06_NODE_2395_length_6958_cov_4.127132_6_plen_83_part_00